MLLPTVNWELVDRHKGYMGEANGDSSPVLVFVRLVSSPILQGALPAAEVFHVLAAVMSSLGNGNSVYLS